MTTSKLLYLQLKLEQKEDYLDLQLQKSGFDLSEKRGEGIESFRKYQYVLPGAEDDILLDFKLMPSKTTTQTVSLKLSRNIKKGQVKQLFENLKHFAASVPLDLLDLDKRNAIYEKLHQQGKVNAYYIGLNDEEQAVVEKQAYIPIDDELLWKNLHTPSLQDFSLRTKGERAPDLDT